MKVSVYYESLCPDSQLFVYNQVAPIFQMFGPEELEVDLNPFGKANVREFFKYINQCQKLLICSGLITAGAGSSRVSTGPESATTTRSRLASCNRSEFKMSLGFFSKFNCPRSLTPRSTSP